jgi:hypothetical protein
MERQMTEKDARAPRMQSNKVWFWLLVKAKNK